MMSRLRHLLHLARSTFALSVALAGQLMLASSGGAVAAPLDPQLPYQAERRSPVTYDVDFSIVVTPPYQTKKLRVWIPVPPSDSGQEVSGSEWTSFPSQATPRLEREPRYGNQFAYFEFTQPQGGQILRHRFRVKVWELHWKLSPERVERIKEWPSAFANYLQGESQAIVIDDRLRKLLGEVVPETTSPLNDLGRIMQWAQSNLKYDHSVASLSASSLHALEKRRGHCSDYHGLCASLGRALGYPTRITYGINTFPKNSPSHCKLEAFLPPYGWVSFDVSETQKLIDKVGQQKTLGESQRRAFIEAARSRLMQGFRDNTWYLQTRGSDYDLAPPASRKVAVVRTAYVEADGVALAEPDPANKQQTQFSWMTAQDFRSDRPVTYPFADESSLESTPGAQR